jgi:hypothetical protein
MLLPLKEVLRSNLLLDNHMKRMGGQSKLPFPKCNGPE